MLTLLGVVLSIGLADSVNPSTVGPALYLASYREGGRSLVGFITGVFLVSAAAGVVLVLGPGRLLLAHRPAPHAEHLVELAAGLALIPVAAALWLARARVGVHVVRRERTVAHASILVGAGIMAVELPTALPYFAVIAAVASSGRSPATQIALVLLFNVTFVAPLLGVLLIRRLAGPRGVDWLERKRQGLERRAGESAAALVLLIAVILVAIGTSGLFAR